MTDFYARAAAQNPAPDMTSGASGFFSPPADTLDPHLFDGTTLKEHVRRDLLGTLWHALESGFHLGGPRHWLHAWLAGSGITYQWSADRGNGDLDVLFGVDFPALLRYNPEYQGLSEAQFSELLNDWLRRVIWPRTANTNFNGQTYEVTYYVNPGTGTDIRNIHPYAAYDIRANEWTVHPPKVAADPESMYPKEWFAQAGNDQKRARVLKDRYTELTSKMGDFPEGSAYWHNAGSELHLTLAQAHALYDDIHTGRHAAFEEQGHGYGDWHNFRWQSAKRSGVVETLLAMTKVQDQGRQDEETDLYGAPIASADEALTRAAMVSRERLNHR